MFQRLKNPRKYRSKAELAFSQFLKSGKISFAYESKTIPYVVEKVYYTDFFLIDYGFYIEYKGYFTGEDRRKHRLIKEQHPDIDIRFVFQNASNRLHRKSKVTYKDWCDKHGFLWADKVIPKKWLEQKRRT